MENQNRIFESEPPQTTPKFSTCLIKHRFDYFVRKNQALDVVGEREKGTSEVPRQAELDNRLNGVAPRLILKPLATLKDVSHDVAPSEGQKQNARRSKAVQNKRRWCYESIWKNYLKDSSRLIGGGWVA